MRLYVVKMGTEERLVKANAPSQAVMHVARGVVEAKAAKPDDVVRIMQAGGAVEKAGDTDGDA